MRIIFSRTIAIVCSALSFSVLLHANDFYGKVDAGFGSLIKPDITDHGVNKGGVTAYFQALYGENNFKCGAEFGVAEAYTSWDKDRFVINKSLVLLPLLAAVEYDILNGRTTPYLGVSAGPYFALEGYTNATPNSTPTSTAEKVYGGYCLWAGAKTRVTKNYDVDLSVRFSQINAAENVTMLGLYVGCGANMSFFDNKKHDNIAFPIKENKKAP